MPDNLPSDRTEFDFLGSIAVPAAALYGPDPTFVSPEAK
jgi:hypothetical protein